MKYIYTLIVLWLISCTPQGKSIQTTFNGCLCQTNGEQLDRAYPIIAEGDSIVLCKSGTINGEDWGKHLVGIKLHEFVKMYNCQTGEYLTFKRTSHSISYEDKTLAIYSNMNFPVYDSTVDKWERRIVVDVYKEIVSAEAGCIKQSDPIFILTPPRLNAKALADVNQFYEQKQNRPNTYYVSDYLLVAALNGDTLAKARLSTFKTDFPKRNEAENVDNALEIIQLFEQYQAENDTITYLDISKYGAFNKYKKDKGDH